jgi:hypothetical protein
MGGPERSFSSLRISTIQFDGSFLMSSLDNRRRWVVAQIGKETLRSLGSRRL